MRDYLKPTKCDFNPDLYILHAGTNDFSSRKSNTGMADYIKVAKMLKSDHNSVAISAIVPRTDNFKENVTEANKGLALKCHKQGISLILHDNINPKRYLNKSKLHSDNYGNIIFVRNLKEKRKEKNPPKKRICRS